MLAGAAGRPGPEQALLLLKLFIILSVGGSLLFFTVGGHGAGAWGRSWHITGTFPIIHSSGNPENVEAGWGRCWRPGAAPLTQQAEVRCLYPGVVVATAQLTPFPPFRLRRQLSADPHSPQRTVASKERLQPCMPCLCEGLRPIPVALAAPAQGVRGGPLAEDPEKTGERIGPTQGWKGRGAGPGGGVTREEEALASPLAPTLSLPPGSHQPAPLRSINMFLQLLCPLNSQRLFSKVRPHPHPTPLHLAPPSNLSPSCGFPLHMQ